jgi:hypothetical protein
MQLKHSELLGFWTLSIVRYCKEHLRTQRFGNRICFRPQVRGWETPTLLGPLERANLNHSPHLRKETDPVSETLCSLEYRTVDKVQKPSNPECHTPSSEPFRICVENDLKHTKHH